jgi:deoxyribodipyrimidine photo-lyase
MMAFPTNLADINKRIDALDVGAYALSRNYLKGTVSNLSPYISRGVISLPYILNRICNRTSLDETRTFIYELCWREYFQRIWFDLGDKIFHDFKQPQQPVNHRQMIQSVVNANTGIIAIDHGVRALYQSGYMHNHVRMYTASIITNIGKAHWHIPSKWMYYHLLDGDLASNTLSWQWVAGTFSPKKYYCNQENINRYCDTQQRNTFLDCEYETLAVMDCPDELKEAFPFNLVTSLPESSLLQLDYSLPLLLYNSYNLDPLWLMERDVNRILILEPSHFEKYPVSSRVMEFILALAKEIQGLQIYCGEVDDIPELYRFPEIISKNHPTTNHYPGRKEEASWMFPMVNQTKGSYTKFWKACEKHLLNYYPS